jgi:predicted transposase YdaD
MIRGLHGLFCSSKPEEMRTFIREKLRLPFSDVGEGWLIFDFQEGDLGVHPTMPGRRRPRNRRPSRSRNRSGRRAANPPPAST